MCEQVLKNYVVKHHVANIKRLENLQKRDKNVVPKLSSLIVCGGSNNVRLSIHIDDAVDWLSDILANAGYAEDAVDFIMTDKQKDSTIFVGILLLQLKMILFLH